MNALDSTAQQWVSTILGAPFSATKHIHSHQDEVYKIETPLNNYYLKVSPSLKAETNNLKRLKGILNVPEVIGFYGTDKNDHLLITSLPGKNLVELIGELPDKELVSIFAKAVKQLHSTDATSVFPDALDSDVLSHGDMALPNIILSDKGNIGYIDFSQLSFGTTELDLVDAIWSLQRNMEPNYGELFLEQYGPATITPKIEEALAFRYQPPEG